MTRGSAREYIATIRPRYLKADRPERSRLLTEATTITGYHRKHLLRLLHRPARLSPPGIRHRPRQYTPEVVDALRIAWEACGYICSRRLRPFLPELVPHLTRVGVLQLRAQTAATLVQISPATIDRALAPFRRSLRPHGLSTTKPGTLLLSQIPIRTFAQWDDAQPGFLEVDLVAHCGTSLASEYAYTLSAVDIATGWCECFAVPNRGERAVFAGLQEIRHRLPVPLRGLDSDNDTAFINNHLLRYCRAEHITLTRCRPYRKNDQAHVEQKNWSVVRRLIGYDRYETPAAVGILNAIYQHLRLYTNFFQPSLKLVRKVRHGARLHRTFDRAQTPYQRLLTSGSLPAPVAQRLETQYRSLNPVALREEIDEHLRRLWRLAAR
jgi:hypothetical protein